MCRVRLGWHQQLLMAAVERVIRFPPLFNAARQSARKRIMDVWPSSCGHTLPPVMRMLYSLCTAVSLCFRHSTCVRVAPSMGSISQAPLSSTAAHCAS